MTHPPQDPEAHPDPEAAQPLPAGTQIGRFRIEASLGAGGMGQVYRAWDATLERSVALKALRPGGDQDAGALERFHREAMALAQLNHPHVCQVHDWVETTAGTYIAMELVAGETLDQTAARLRTRDKLAVLLAVARALEAAHAKGLIHRDLKPANIMVSVAPGARPDVKVLDFGLARLLDAQGEQATPAPVPNLSRPLVAPERLDEATAIRSDAGSPPDQTFRGPSGGPSWDRLTQAGAFMGSPAYASPEQIQGQPAGPASDVFSLGILGWELLTGEPPFPGKGRARIQATLHGRLRPFKGHGAPRAVAELLTGMLDPHPFRRPTAAQVAKTLERLLKPRSALRWALASAAAALLLAGGGFFFLSRGILSGFGTGRPVRLLVLPFGNATGNPDLEVVAQHAIPEMLEAALRQQTRLLPLSADALVQARAALHLPAQDALRPAEETRLASALGADLILRGSLVPDDKGVLAVRFDLRDLKGRTRLARQERVGTGLALAIPTARAVARDLFQALEPLGTTPRNLLPDLPPEVLTAFSKGREQLLKGNFKEAAPLFQEAARRAPDFVPAVLGYARCLNRLADAPPEPVFQWARWSAQAQGNRSLELEALHLLMIRYGDRGQWDAADRAGAEALSLARSLEDPSAEAGIHSTLGVHLQRRNQLAEAQAEYETALDLFQKGGDRLAETRVLNNLAVLARSRGDLAGAERQYQRALETVRSLGDRWGESIVLNNLGDLALAQDGGLDRAESLYQQALVLRQEIGDQAGMTYTLVGLATVAQTRGNLAAALGFETQALEQARKTQLKPMEGVALYNLGELNREAGKMPEALAAYGACLDLHRELGDTGMQALALAGEAECQARQGRRQQAQALLDQARKLSPEESPYFLRAEAWVARASNREDEARALFTKALAAAHTQAPEIVPELNAALR